MASLAAAAFFARLPQLQYSVFEDEVWVAESVTASWIPHGTATPPLFFLLSVITAQIAGYGRTALRIIPLVVGVAVCGLPLLSSVLTRQQKAFLSLLLAFSSPLIFYSTRIKQYTLEAAWSMLLILLLLEAVVRRKQAAWLLFFGAGAVGIMGLHSPPFVIAAAGLALLLSGELTFRRAAGFVFNGACFIAAYVLYLAPGPDTVRIYGDMQDYFAKRGGWVDSPDAFIAGTRLWLGHALNLTPLGWLVGVLATIAPMRERSTLDKLVIALAVGIPLSVAAASAMRLYPYGEIRLMIFAFPAVFLLLSVGLLRGRTAALPSVAAWLFGIAFVFGGLWDRYNHTYMRIHDLTPQFTQLAENHDGKTPIHAQPHVLPRVLYEQPQLAPFLREWSGEEPRGDGWYFVPNRSGAPEVTLQRVHRGQ